MNFGACGIYCEHCPTYRGKEKCCLGCEWFSEQLRKVRESQKGCSFRECAEGRKVASCFLCDEFPMPNALWKGRDLYFGSAEHVERSQERRC